MPVICPTITAETEQEYQRQMEVVAHFSRRIHIDLSDGQFTPNQLVTPEAAWWPVGMLADIHLMYKRPLSAIEAILEHGPNMIIVHSEADGDYSQIVSLCNHAKVRVGLALLPQSQPEAILPAIDSVDHVLIFSGNLGYQGGSRADLELLNKLSILKAHKPDLEIGWDGGINDQNISQLVSSGIDVLNVGGYIGHSDNPAQAYSTLQRIADETGTA